MSENYYCYLCQEPEGAVGHTQFCPNVKCKKCVQKWHGHRKFIKCMKKPWTIKLHNKQNNTRKKLQRSKNRKTWKSSGRKRKEKNIRNERFQCSKSSSNLLKQIEDTIIKCYAKLKLNWPIPKKISKKFKISSI